jgi:ligand-binding SRPBCC domain-containing protein
MDLKHNRKRHGDTMPKQGGDIITGRENGLFTLQTEMNLPGPPETVFPFFADAGNLGKITPPWLNFKILTPLPIEMRTGTMIKYRLRLHGIALRWQSNITVYDPPHRFVDEQLCGPYKKWIHEHTFTRCVDGSKMRDFVQYDLIGGRLINFLFVRREVRRIFLYRINTLLHLFR